MTKATLVTNSKNNIDLVLEPVKSGEPLSELDIRELIANSEYTALFVNNGNIKNSIAELNSVLKPLQAGKTGREIKYEILVRRDATIKFNIDADEMSAEAEISTAMGGKHLGAKAILDAAKEAGIKKGFSKEKLIAMAQLAAKAEPGTVVTQQIASGREPENGKDAKIKPLVESAQARILKPREREDGSVDMRDLGDIVCVKVGEPLAKKVPLTPGIKGFTVTATPLEPEAGNDTKLMVGDGTAISPKNENVLISTKVGLPKIIDNGMEVDEVYKIKNVDVSTGHINFEGSVIIDGDVSEGMRVVASGDISVGGFVESASLEAGGDITITSGIIGRKQDVENSDIKDFQMSVKIKAKGNIFAKYCQYAEINCNSDLRIENQLMHSLLRVDGKVWVGTEEKANGKLIGGYINCGQSVHAGIVGATAGSKTIIHFESKIDEFKTSLAEIEDRLKIESDKTDELKGAADKLKKLPKEQQNKAMLSKVITTYQFHAKQMGAILIEKEELDNSLQSYMTSVYVSASEKLYQSVDMTIGDFTERTKREYGPSRMIYKERKILIEPIVNT